MEKELYSLRDEYDAAISESSVGYDYAYSAALDRLGMSRKAAAASR